MNLGRDLYLDLLKRCLVNSIYEDPRARKKKRKPFDWSVRRVGGDWPATAHTMIGMERLDNLQMCLERVLRDGVPGDVIETGVWRGGATILMRAVLKAYGVTDRTVWVADSFAGLPPPDANRYPHDAGDRHHTFKDLCVSRADVEVNFAKYDLLDAQVRFLEGWFRDTLPSAPIDQLAVVRLDGDMYESTMDGLVHLYPKLSSGGYLIVDDYGAVPACKAAVEDYRREHGITDEIQQIDWTGVYWRRS